jgi:predicted DNA-binding helix-hairpin-helix protein
MIVGASPETDLDILTLSSKLYASFGLKRVYYSAYAPVNDDPRLPALGGPPLKREHRLYQSDWLYRFYGFSPQELLDEGQPFLDPDLDPKAAWALRHLERFPVDVNRAAGAELLRVPGLGPRSQHRILAARRTARVRRDDLKALGVVGRKADPFLRFEGDIPRVQTPGELRRLLADPEARRPRGDPSQLELFL